MKKIEITLLLLLACVFTGQSQNFQWANGFGGTNVDEGRSVTIDGAGNVYATGSFAGTADFDPSAATATLLSNGGVQPDIYIAKYNSSGVYQWAFKIGGTAADDGSGIATDAAGNIYVTGSFNGSVDFDPSAANAIRNSGGNDNVFVAKYNSAGVYQWVFNIMTNVMPYHLNVATDASSNVLITGNFNGTADFNPGAPVNNLTSLGGSETYVGKYTTAGAYVWAFSLGTSSSNDEGFGITSDPSSNVFVTGRFQNTVDFDPSASTATLTTGGNAEIFLAKYDAAGTYQWASNFGSGGADFGYAVATDATGNIYLTGYFSSVADFDPSVGTATLSSNGGADAFLAKYNTSGAYQWAFKIGSGLSDFGQGVSADGLGNIYVTGYFQGLTDFDPSASTSTLTPTGGRDAFVAAYNASGNYQWAVKLGGAVDDEGWDISADAIGNIYLTGYFQGVTDFDPSPSTYTLNSTSNNHDVFIMKLTNGSVGVNIPENTTNNVIVYPNPSSGKFSIQFNNEMSSEATITVYDVVGKIVSETKIEEGIQQLDLNLESKGMYFVSMESEGKRMTKKLVVE